MDSFQRGALPADARLGTFCGPGCIRKATGLPDANLLNERIGDNALSEIADEEIGVCRDRIRETTPLSADEARSQKIFRH